MSDESGGQPPKRLKQYAARAVSPDKSPSANYGNNVNNSVIIKGTSKKLRQYNPLELDKGLRKAIGGNYIDIKVLPSGDLCVKCANHDQVSKLILCDSIGPGKNPIPIRAELYKTKTAEVRGVISDVPLDLSEEEIKKSLSNLRVTYVRRMNYSNKDGETPSGSVLLCFATAILPPVVSIGYIRFRTRPYNPPPLRCYNCNRYGHKGIHCRSSQRCKKCGSNHSHSDCTNPMRCVNCGGPHSAAYGGCPRYRLEAQAHSVMTSQKVDYWTARKLLQNKPAPPSIASLADFPLLPQPLPSSQQHRQSSSIPQPIANESRKLPSRVHITNPSDDVITFSSKKFFTFIAEVMKHTLEAFSQSKKVDVDAIITKSAGSQSGIQLPLPSDSSDASGLQLQSSAMDVSQQSSHDLVGNASIPVHAPNVPDLHTRDCQIDHIQR